jgi:ABC-type xylose transport system substrate-binding protein
MTGQNRFKSVLLGLAIPFVAFALLSSTACGSPATGTTDDTPATSIAPKEMTFGIIFPDDLIPNPLNPPTNSWSSLSADVSDALTHGDFKASDIERFSSSTFDDQLDDINNFSQKLVDSTVPDAAGKAVLFIAPFDDRDATTAQYDQLLGNTAGGQSDDAIVDALSTLKAQGVKVITIGQNFDNFTPDAFIQTTDAYHIGVLEAVNLSEKIQLSTATAQSPKSIEIFLPLASDANVSGQFFDGVWSILGTYFQKGTAIDPSGLLTSSSTSSSWPLLMVDTTSSDSLKNDIQKRFGQQQPPLTPPRLDGVIAGTDMVAAQIIQTLTDLSYVGTAADVNPDISIGNIIRTIGGQRDITKSEVPHPKAVPDASSTPTTPQAPDVSSPDTTDAPNVPNAANLANPSNSADSSNPSDAADGMDSATGSSDAPEELRWPIVVGFGSDAVNLPAITSGHQWATGLVDQKGIASVCEEIGMRVSGGLSFKNAAGFTQTTIDKANKTDVPSALKPLISVSASNLKKALVDNGYISASQAGL